MVRPATASSPVICINLQRFILPPLFLLGKMPPQLFGARVPAPGAYTSCYAESGDRFPKKNAQDEILRRRGVHLRVLKKYEIKILGGGASFSAGGKTSHQISSST